MCYCKGHTCINIYEINELLSCVLGQIITLNLTDSMATWELKKTRLPLTQHACYGHLSYVYIFGGYDRGIKFTDTVEKYSIEDDKSVRLSSKILEAKSYKGEKSRLVKIPGKNELWILDPNSQDFYIFDLLAEAFTSKKIPKTPSSR